MEISTRKQRLVTIVSITGRMTIGTGDVMLRAKFRELLEAGDRLFLFQMAGVEYMDSSGIAELVACAKRAYERGAVIKVVLSPSGKPGQIFAITGLDRVFELFADEREALDGFSA